MIFNEIIPQDIGRKPRNSLSDMFALEVDTLCGKKDLGKIVDQVYQKHGIHETALVLDAIKALGFKYSTRGAVTVSVNDIVVPPEKPRMLAEADGQVKEINDLFSMASITAVIPSRKSSPERLVSLSLSTPNRRANSLSTLV